MPETKNLPLMFNEEELAMLENSHLINLISQIKGDITKFYTENKVVSDALTLEELMHVNALMMSRKFGLSNESVDDCMVPYGDMLNHGKERNVDY
jgi:hypothetical protein